jgi:hypothetical protein
MPKEDRIANPQSSSTQQRRSLRLSPDQVHPKTSVEAVAGSVIQDVCDDQRGNSPKLILDVPNDIYYSMRRWLEAPYRTSPWWLVSPAHHDGKRQGSGHSQNW